MAFPDPATFFKAFGLMFLGTAFVGGVVYWMVVMFKKSFPNSSLWFKYSVLKKKHNEKDVIQLLQYQDAGKSADEVMKLILLAGFNVKKAKEFIYIYNQIQQKGGKKNE